MPDTNAMGSALKTEAERQLLADLSHYGVSDEGFRIEWRGACGEGHCTSALGGALEEVSGLAVLDEEHNAVAEGWIDFIHGGGDNPLYVFWLFLSIYSEEKWHKVKAEPTIPEHIWERLPEQARLLCAKEDADDTRWAKDPRVHAWRQRQAA